MSLRRRTQDVRALWLMAALAVAPVDAFAQTRGVATVAAGAAGAPASAVAVAAAPAAGLAPTFDAGRVRAFLAEQPLIRLAVPAAPGNGHQAVAATIAKRLRALGFGGRLELIYNEEGKDKLDLTLPGFDPYGPDVQELPEMGAVAVSREEFRRRGSVAPVALSISAAAEELSGEMRSAVHANIEPFAYGTPTLTTGAGPEAVLTLARHLILLDAPRPEDPAGFIAASHAHSERLRRKTEGLQALAAAAPKLEILPAYGLSDADSGLFTLLEGIRRAQRRAPQSFRGAVVVPLFSHLDDASRARLFQRIRADGAGSRLDTALRGASVLDADFVAATLAELAPGEILLLRVGGVSQAVFEYFFSRQTLAGTLAGANAQNLMHVLGLPFLNTVGEFFKHDVIRGAGEKTQRFVGDANLGLTYGGPDAVARFLLAARNPRSPVAAAFARTQPRDDSEDKVARMIDLAARRLP